LLREFIFILKIFDGYIIYCGIKQRQKYEKVEIVENRVEKYRTWLEKELRELQKN